jgi:hypothetical protein
MAKLNEDQLAHELLAMKLIGAWPKGGSIELQAGRSSSWAL